jgi:hypothetical protein
LQTAPTSSSFGHKRGRPWTGRSTDGGAGGTGDEEYGGGLESDEEDVGHL